MDDFETALNTEYPRLVGLCGYLVGNPADAPDLAQETLIEAWRNRHKLVDPTGLHSWLSAIARNVCLRHKARLGRNQNLIQRIAQQPPEEIPFEALLEREELSALLQQALALLPTETRTTLVARFIEGLTPAEIAQRLGITQNNVALRLHRGKGALEEIVRNELRDEFAELSLFDTGGQWQTTSLFCPMCGTRRLEGKLNPAIGQLLLRCPHCNAEPGDLFNATESLPQVLNGVKGFKPAYNRLLKWSATYYVPGLRSGSAPCTWCGQPVTPTLVLVGGEYKIDASCPHCGCINYSSLQGAGMALPEGQQFWKENPQMRLLPNETIAEAQGEPAILMRRESVTSSHQIEILFGLRSFQFLNIEEG
jgi:RNA polymerase sigma-70 factor (ECF subfamily)